MIQCLPAPCLEGRTLWIDGVWQSAASDASFDTVNPATGEVILAIARGGAEDIDAAVRAAHQASRAWFAMGGGDRARILRRTADAVRDHRGDLGLLDTLDSGRPISETSGRSAEGVARLFEFNAGLADSLRGAVVPAGDGQTALVEREPYGVVGAISPWNYPLSNAATKIAPVLACGNAIVLKPAEQTPLSVLLLARLMAEAGLPAGVLNIVTGFGTEAGAALVEHPMVGKLTFTGSTATGRCIAEAAGRHLKGVVLELGGKSPMLVFEDADLHAAAQAAVLSVFGNVGQTCTSCSRLIVAEGVRDRLLGLIRDEVARLRIGDPMDPGTQVGPLVSQVQLERVSTIVSAAEGRPLPLDLPRYKPLDAGCFHPPTVLTDVPSESAIAREEVFGPVMTVFSFRTDEEALRLANDSGYGLAASVWTSSLGRAEKLRRSIEAGLVWINCVHALNPGIPVAGHKASGLGSEYGAEAVENYTRIRASVTMSGAWRSPFA